MIAGLAIAMLGAAVAGDEDESPLCAKFRVLYGLGDRVRAYQILFDEVGPGGRDDLLVDAQLKVLRPVLLSLVAHLQRQETLEGLKEAIEEVDRFLTAWYTWPPVLEQEWGLDFEQVLQLSRHGAPYARLAWGGKVGSDGRWQVQDDDLVPSQRAEIPIFSDPYVTPMFVIPAEKSRKKYDRAIPGSRDPEDQERGKRTLVSHDKDRVLVRWARPSAHGIYADHFEIWPLEFYLAGAW